MNASISGSDGSIDIIDRKFRKKSWILHPILKSFKGNLGVIVYQEQSFRLQTSRRISLPKLIFRVDGKKSLIAMKTESEIH